MDEKALRSPAGPDSMNGADIDMLNVGIEMPDERTVNYVFPVEIVVVGALPEVGDARSTTPRG